MKKKLLSITILAALLGNVFAQNSPGNTVNNEDRIKPWSEDNRYWQYKGEPVLLLGGSKTDHLFLADDLLGHLDEIKEAGANYVRNTMSQREAKELKPYLLLPEGKHDLNKWNVDYWTRFENMLKWTSESDIIVQIEVWDRFDYSMNYWPNNPWNPDNNINYSWEDTPFERKYPNSPNDDLQPFFHSIPGMPLYKSNLDPIRKRQEAFVAKMLSYSLKYGHVIYCMNNETSTPPAWGQYWIDFIKAKAEESGVIVYATDMFDDAYKGSESVDATVVFDNPNYYMFADISQVNSRNFGDDHWEVLTWMLQQVHSKHPRPVNHTKIYGGAYHTFGTGGYEDGIERFWRNILAGSASSRFHRQESGAGLNERAKACIRAARLAETYIKFWDIEPHMELLQSREPNEAYLAAKPGEFYMLYFPYTGSVDLNLSTTKNAFNLSWISISEGTKLWYGDKTIEGGSVVTISSPFKGGWVAVISKK